MSKLNVKFKTLTPLWTSNAWGQCMEIRPSSILGSLRFWFEVLCYFNGIIDDNYFDEDGKSIENLNYDEFKKILRKKIEDKIKNDEKYEIEELIDETLSELGISLPSRIFGCTGWRGRIKIKKIEPIEDYCFENRLNLPYAIGIKKDNDDKNIIEWRTKNDYHQFIKEKYNGDNNNFKKDWSVWYFSDPYFYGKFEVTFETDKTIKDAVLIPLLNFIDEYGYIGGKWNIGYGRVKILNNDWDKDKTTFELSKFGDFKDFDFKDIDNYNKNFIFNYSGIFKNKKEYELIKYILGCDKFYCKRDRDLKNKIQNMPKEIGVIKFNDLEFDNAEEKVRENVRELIKKLLLMKMKMRNCLRHECENNLEKCYDERDSKKKFNEKKIINCKIKGKEIKIKCGTLKEWHDFRHRLLGSTGQPAQGTKILPYIYEEDDKLKGGFVSIAGILNIKGGGNENQTK